MSLTNRLRNLLATSPKPVNESDLVRLRRFLDAMKEAGIVKVREYDLPQTDTIGSSQVARSGWSAPRQPIDD